jgi:hypothetical protein
VGGGEMGARGGGHVSLSAAAAISKFAPRASPARSASPQGDEPAKLPLCATAAPASPADASCNGDPKTPQGPAPRRTSISFSDPSPFLRRKRLLVATAERGARAARSSISAIRAGPLRIMVFTGAAYNHRKRSERAEGRERTGKVLSVGIGATGDS